MLMVPPRAIMASAVIGLLLAACFLRSSIYLDAVTLYTDVVARSPEKARPHNNLGDALLKAHRHEEARAHIERALAILPDYPDALNNLATVLIRDRRHQEALDLLLRTLELKPDHAEARFNLAVGLYQWGQTVEAEQHFRLLLQYAPGSSQAVFAERMIGVIRGGSPR